MRWSRTRITCLAVPMVAFTIALYVGNALAPTLIKDAPVLLLVLAPKIRWLLLISQRGRRAHLLPRPARARTAVLIVYFLLGHWYGDRSLRWLEQRTGNALRPVLWVERNFHRARVPVTFLFPGNVSALLAGADGMPVALFFVVALASVALRLWAVRALAEILRGPILQVVQWIGDNQLWLTVVSVAVVMIWVGWSNRHGLAGCDRLRRRDRRRRQRPRPASRTPSRPRSLTAGGASASAAGTAPDRRRRRRPRRSSRPTSGENLKPWPEQGDATTTGPTRSMTKSSVAVVV